MVAKQLKLTSKQRQNKIHKIPRSITQDADTVKYYLALTDPFNPEAVGARVPDMHAAHTATYTIRATHTVTADTNGNAYATFFPNVAAASYLVLGNSPDYSNINWGDGGAQTAARWGINVPNFSSKLDNYRIVGYGIRVTNLSSMTNSQGKFVMGSYPISSSWHTRDFQIGNKTLPVDGLFTRQNTIGDWGIPMTTTGTITPSLLVQYPGAQLRSALDMAEKAYDIVARPVDPRCFNFRAANNTTGGWETAGALAGGVVTTGSSEYLDLNGFEALFVSLTGGVASTSSYDIEVVYHIEGRPYLSGISGVTAQNELVVPAATSASPVNPLGFMEAVATAVRQPAVKDVIGAGADLISPMLGHLARAVL